MAATNTVLGALACALGMLSSASAAGPQCPGNPSVSLCVYDAGDDIGAHTNATLFVHGAERKLEATLVHEKAKGYLIQALDAGEVHCKPGLILPLFMSEDMWGFPRTILYLIALLWCFVGVAIIADIFMAAIEVITSQSREVSYVDSHSRKHKTIEVLVWNETIANLTLMALGSSAPEILLAVIETVGTLGKPPEGGLGPSTIVGSAAFNLLMILAICVVSVPKGEVRRVKELGVFAITSFSSIFAYMWLLFVLQWNTENVVDLGEAIVTLLFFPLLVGLSFAADKGWFRGNKVGPSNTWITGTGGMGASGYGEHGELEAGTRGDSSGRRRSVLHVPKRVSRATYRINGIRQLTGGARVYVPKRKLQELEEETRRAARQALEEETKSEHATVVPLGRQATGVSVLPIDSCEVSFSTSTYGAYEHQGKVTLHVCRIGCMDRAVAVQFETSNGTALAGEDYEFTSGVLHFAPEQDHATIEVIIHDDDKFEGDENFFCTLKAVPDRMRAVDAPAVLFGHYPTTEVTIIDDDNPGVFSFGAAAYTVAENVGTVELEIVRSEGSDGSVVVTYASKDGSAIATRDYKPVTGTIEFAHGELRKTLEVPIIDDNKYEKDESFSVAFTIKDQEECGADYGKHRTTTVNITNDEEFKKLVDKMATMINFNLDKLKVRTDSWGEQYKSAMSVHGEDMDREGAVFDYVMHFISFFWKVLFAAVPPTSIMGGWLAFFVALFFIAILTIFIGDFASIFGCNLGMEDAITAITFVALGTSLPDLFASRAAAVNDAHADASVGNVTGSNSVNVFLGLGLPWVIAAVYHEVQGTSYVVDAGSLSFSVLVFCCSACLCIATLFLRRVAFGGELGGNVTCKYFTGAFFTLMWLGYIVLSSLQAKGMFD